MTADTARTAEALAADLRGLGVAPGHELLVHCSMRRIGRTCGGAAALLCALRIAAGPTVTVIVPTQTTWNSQTSRAFREATAGLNEAQLEEFVAAMPGF